MGTVALRGIVVGLVVALGELLEAGRGGQVDFEGAGPGVARFARKAAQAVGVRAVWKLKGEGLTQGGGVQELARVLGRLALQHGGGPAVVLFQVEVGGVLVAGLF